MNGAGAAMTAFDLTGKCALVTGASRGLGRHFAEVLARHGAKLAVAARDVDRLAELCEALASNGASALAVAMDVGVSDSVRKALETVRRDLGPIDILVNNAGVAISKQALEVEESDWDLVMDTNLKGAWLVAREAARQMVEAGTKGSIINIASITGLRVAGQLSTYAASKAAVIHLTKAMALELSRHGIRVNALAPGYIETDINREFFSSAAGEALIKRIPQRRLGRLSELDGPLLLLASEASSYMTGSVVVVDGGHLQSSL
jgi:NAD(P)-dependent dehydrogenase (short-subunit alcohol dehydrogenase family)